MNKNWIKLGMAAWLLGSLQVSQPVQAQEVAREAKLHTYVMENPYDVPEIKAPKGKKVKNVVLMIGDGMSLMHVYSAWTANRGKLYLDNSQVVGLSKTYCADKLVTDSGAGGTAIATGQKTNYHYVGVDPQGNELPSLITLSKEKGLSAGIAVTCRLWDATPADFCCHNTDRDDEYDLIADYVPSVLMQRTQLLSGYRMITGTTSALPLVAMSSTLLRRWNLVAMWGLPFGTLRKIWAFSVNTISAGRKKSSISAIRLLTIRKRLLHPTMSIYLPVAYLMKISCAFASGV